MAAPAGHRAVMADSSPAKARRPLRPRTREAVLDAALGLLHEGGLTAVTVDAISARAKVSKPTIYRHWPNRLAIAIDAFAGRMARQVPLADTGSPEADLVEQVRRVAGYYATEAGAVFAQLLGAATLDPQAAEQLRDRFYADRRAQTGQLWQRAIDRGVARPGIDADTAIDLLFGPMVFRLLVGHAPCDPEAAAALAEAALDGLLDRSPPGPGNQD